MVMQAYAAVMAARNVGGTSHFDPSTIAEDLRNKGLRQRVYESSLAPTQLIIAENDERAKENTDHLMSTVLREDHGYQNQAFSVTAISRDIERYFHLLSGATDDKKIQFYLLGGWIFLQRQYFPFTEQKLVAQSGIGRNHTEAIADFFVRFDSHIAMRRTVRLGYVFRFREVAVDELMAQYVFQTPCSSYH